MSNDELRARLLLMGFKTTPAIYGDTYSYSDEHGLRCRVNIAVYISISWISKHPLNFNCISGTCVTPEAAFREVKQGLSRHDKE